MLLILISRSDSSLTSYSELGAYGGACFIDTNPDNILGKYLIFSKHFYFKILMYLQPDDVNKFCYCI